LRRRYYKFFLDNEEKYGYNINIKENSMIVAETLDDAEKSSEIYKVVEKDSKMKEWLVEYVGRHYQAELARAVVQKGESIDWDGNVTVEMVVELMAKEFPEFLMAVAEENFIRGYRQAFADTEMGMELAAAEDPTEPEDG